MKYLAELLFNSIHHHTYFSTAYSKIQAWKNYFTETVSRVQQVLPKLMHKLTENIRAGLFGRVKVAGYTGWNKHTQSLGLGLVL